MIYRLEDKQIELNVSKKSPLIAKGKNGNVYGYGTSALKVFDDLYEPPIDYETARYMTSIYTDRILLPRKLLFYNDSFAGYSMKLIQKKGNVKKLINSPKEQLINNIKCLEQDVEIISNHRILMSDMSPENVQYNGKLYISDPSKYRLFDVKSTDGLEKINLYQLHLLLTELFSEELRRINFSILVISRLKAIFGLRDIDQTPSEYLNEIIDEKDTIKEMVKRITR